MGNSSVVKVIIGCLLAAAILWACAPKTAPAPVATPAPVAAPAPATMPSPAPAKTGADQEWQKVLSAARQEGKVTLYSTFGAPELRTTLDKAMAENYGIKIEWLVAPGGAINAERIRVEQKAGQYVADVWWTGASVLLTRELRGIGALKPFTPYVVASQPDVWRDQGVDSFTDQRDALTITQSVGGLIVVNSTLVSPAGYPKSFKDLLDPKWKGKIVMMDPTVPGGGAYIFGLLKREHGLGFWDTMKGQNISFIRDYSQVARHVAIGEAPIGLGLSPIHVMALLLTNAPIKLLPASEGGYVANILVSLINNAPHPNAARVLINWMLTKEGQESVAFHTGTVSVRKDVEYKPHPEVAGWFKSEPKFLTLDFKVTEEFDAEVAGGTARKIFGLK